MFKCFSLKDISFYMLQKSHTVAFKDICQIILISIIFWKSSVCLPFTGIVVTCQNTFNGYDCWMSIFYCTLVEKLFGQINGFTMTNYGHGNATGDHERKVSPSLGLIGTISFSCSNIFLSNFIDISFSLLTLNSNWIPHKKERQPHHGKFLEEFCLVFLHLFWICF